jgi:hypothetical protein
MARTALPLTSLTGNTAVLNNAGTAIDATNGMVITIPTKTIPAGGNIDRLVLYVQNSTASTKTVTVRAGANIASSPDSPAFEAGKGDLTTGNLTASTGTAFIGPFEVARFLQPDATLQVDFAASTTGTIWAILLPRAF